MGILIDKHTKLVVQGITGRDGSFHTQQMLAYGTVVVAGVTPGKGGQRFEKAVPIFNKGVPALDMTRVMPYLQAKGVRLIGPNCPGLISPGQAKVGIIPGRICAEGPVGVVSRSGTLTYEVVYQLT